MHQSTTTGKANRPRIFPFLILLLSLAGCLLIAGCSAGPKSFVIVSGSENDSLAPILDEYAKSKGVKLEFRYLGSVDIMNLLKDGAEDVDAVWPANSMWLSLGDSSHLVRKSVSFMQSPVAFGIKEQLARKLGFVGHDVRVKDILAAIQARKLRFMMTSATQSNSGASAYIGFLYALAGSPEYLDSETLRKPAVRDGVRQILAGINRSSGSSGWLRDLFVSSDYDAMVNYESMLIEANKALAAKGKETLHIVYPIDGTVIADSPLALIAQEDDKAAFYKGLTDYLLSAPVQAKIVALGRRPAFAGSAALDPAVFNEAWGIDTKRTLAPIRMPDAKVMEEALVLYQTEYRKPSYTVFCLDFSGSMSGDREAKVKAAMDLLLDQEQAGKYLIQTGSQDKIVVIPFSHAPWPMIHAEGSDPASLVAIDDKIKAMEADGGTDIYTPVIEGLKLLASDPKIDGYVPAVVLMTDGESNTGKSFDDLQDQWKSLGRDIPIFSIAFGEANQDQLQEIADLSRSRVFDGRKDLASSFRAVKGYN